MANDRPNWEGLLKWSLSHSDGNRPSRNLSEEDRRWFMEAMQAHSVDVIARMKDITRVMKTPVEVLEAQGVTEADIEDMLDELQEHVESIDMANDLHSIGGLDPLLGYLKDSPAKIQAKAAEVITTIVQNNPKGQQMVMQANGLEPLLSVLTSDCDDVTVRTKALGAISSLIRHNEKGIEAFRLGQGYAALRDALSSGNARFQRKALNLIHYLLQENRSECNVISDLGFPRSVMHLASSEDTDVREAALRCLLELAQNRTDGSSGSLGEKEKVKQILQDRIKGISLMSPEDLGAVKEERELVDSLWNAYYEGPSPLQKKGLVVLPGEDALPPDVASEHFQPPLRAWAACRAADKNASTEKKETPLLLGPGPPAEDAAHAESSSSTGAAAGDGKSSTT